MKKILIFLVLILCLSEVRSQTSTGARLVPVAQAIQDSGFTIQVGLPFLGTKNGQHITTPLDVRFPWDILYLYGTFAEEYFDISKGYFGDKVLITWNIRNNYDKINVIKIYRREYKETNIEAFNQIGSVSKDETSYEDKYVEGGVLYEYKLEAEGVSDVENLYDTYITGIGYRSPTAVITGNVSYEGGNPVKDVTIKASSEGSSVNPGSSVKVPINGYLEVKDINRPIKSATTLQAWVKPVTQFTAGYTTPISVFRLENSEPATNPTLDLKVYLNISDSTLHAGFESITYVIKNFIPSGRLDSRGNDQLIKVSEFNNNFVHFSVVVSNGEIPQLYINGRKMDQSYEVMINQVLDENNEDYVGPYFDITVPTNTLALNPSGETKTIYVGGGSQALFDEIRIWNDTIPSNDIRTDYRRYISGNDSRLISYLSTNEGVGEFAYDLSRVGFEYNKNHGRLWNATTTEADKASWSIGSGNIPSADQLGILGVTDSHGNYQINAIPYSGTGETFNITPMYGQHQFSPNQQLVFLGQGSEIVNNIDFIDKSSFVFTGKVLFDSRGVFKSFVELGSTEDSDKIQGPGIIDEGYNYYELSNEKFYKGEFWFNDNGTTDDDSDDYLERYARIASKGVQIYVDGEVILDENNLPVTTDAEGNFSINVPIGNHYINVKKEGHGFVHQGRFPAQSGTFHEFFEDANEQTYFIDTTRVTLVGRVVGGAVQAQKTIGFGHLGLRDSSYVNAEGISENIVISSKNNIGIASITMDYKPPSGSVTPYTKINFKTNAESGEYRVDLLPLTYTIEHLSGLNIVNNSISLLSANETLNVTQIEDQVTPEFKFPDGNILNGLPYQYEKSFVYRSTPVLKVVEQTSDPVVKIGEDEFSTDGFAYPVYTQFSNYSIVMNSFERYNNYDTGTVEDIVPVIDGEFVGTNNLALAGSEGVEADPNDASIITYSFKAGLPSISPPFIRNIDIRYRVNGVDYQAENYTSMGIILGGQSDGSQTFVTAAPDVPDIILRDPPGSNSFASIEKGQSITFTSERNFAHSEGGEQRVKVMLGAEFSIGGGLAGPVITTETTNSADLGIGITNTSSDGHSLTKTYTFSQTISTSDDPFYVGAMGDLYIGQSKNYFYGSYDDVQTSTEILPGSSVYPLTNNDEETIFVSKQKAMYFVEEPSETFFIYSQHHILETLIPELELIVLNIENGIISESDPGVMTKAYYTEQIRLWKKMVLENEKAKYEVKNNRAELKANLEDIVDNFNDAISEELSKGGDSPAATSLLNKKLNASENIENLLDESFEDNISFDAGVGEFTRTVETEIVNSTSLEYELSIDESFMAEYGFKLNGAGLIANTSGFFNQTMYSALSEEESKTTTISYTLKDNDEANMLSVDVVNLFDGHGPIFSTIGGRTSCPYEPAEMSVFYNHADYDPKAKEINELEEDKQEELSYATQKVEVPLISVEASDISNVPEGRNAEFKLILENYSASETAAYFLLKVDNLSNPNNALVNIEANGTVVFVPYGEKVYFTMTLGKSISDVYSYDSIRVVLQSICDEEEVFDEVYVSANFIPSCSEVIVEVPANNWVFNLNTAYNMDGSTNTLPIKLMGYNTEFDSFKKIVLEYRQSGSPSWNRLQTYYTTQEYFEEAEIGGETEIALIESPEIYYAWDILEMNLPDANYEIRARSFCNNGTDFTSEIITGLVDLNAPKRFGTPLPIDGILSSGEDLKVGFNESIFYNSAVSNIEIKGQTNQLKINHQVSIYFDGEENTLRIDQPSISTGDLSIEFWMKNETTETNAIILQQNNGLQIGLENGNIYFTLGGVTAKGGLATDGLFHHYTFTHRNSSGDVSIYEDDAEIAGEQGSANMQFTNTNPLIFGGNNFIGNIHDLRLWNKSISLENAYAKMYDRLIGNENKLIGYWPLDEGRGNLAKDIARYKHAQILNASWDIKPKGTSYEFNASSYLEMDNVDFVQMTPEMDATISFWIKTGSTQEACIFSNGRGDGSDIVQSNGYANKWSINTTSAGQLTLESEGMIYLLSDELITDNAWHHVSLLFNRLGSLKTYVDAELVSSNNLTEIGGLSGNKIWLGLRGFTDMAGVHEFDRHFTGKIDEFRIWNTLRNFEQINRDRYEEISIESIGLLFYARMNAPDPETGNGPRYYHAYSNQTVIPSNALVMNGALNYSDDAPPIKPERDLIKFQVNHVINEDEMILEPVVADWASLEGQILDITVHRMFDAADNMQGSPVTWTAYVRKNEVSWYAEGFNEIVEILMTSGEDKSFEISIVNTGGLWQPYNIMNIPAWLNFSQSSGNIAPDSKITLTATIDKELTPGDYDENLYLETDFGYDEKMQIKLKVLAQEPNWTIDPNTFDYSMNMVSKIKIDGVLSTDSYDMIAATCGGELRGVAKLHYDESYQEYFSFLTIHSNNAYGDQMEFTIWDASQGKSVQAEIDGALSLEFHENEVMGTFSQPVIFENSGNVVQRLDLSQGWTWISFFVNDQDFNNLNKLTAGMMLETSDRIMSHSPSHVDIYDKNEFIPENSSWTGTISANGGISNAKMYKINLAHKQAFDIDGEVIDLSNWSFPIRENWNWLPYPLSGNWETNEALAYFDAAEGDVIKSQNLFAIYDPITGWKGTLNYLVSGEGYMLRSSKDQDFSYPTYMLKSGSSTEYYSDSQKHNFSTFSKFANNMSAVVSLPKNYKQLFVYDDKGRLRGQSESEIFKGTPLCFITIYADAAEELTVYVGNEFNKMPCVQKISYSPDQVLGTIENPFQLDLQNNFNGLLVSPNPFNHSLRLEISVEEAQEAELQIYSTSSQLLFNELLKLSSGKNTHQFTPAALQPGVYVMHLRMKNANLVRKIIKQ